jgi:hypothetical protein
MWWFWPKFLSKSDNTVTYKFCPSAVYIFVLPLQSDTASHAILTSTPCFIFPGLHVLNLTWPCHGIVVLSSDSSLGCKLTWFSLKNIHTQAVFWRAFLHFVFTIKATWFTTFFLLLYLPLSLVKSKGQIEIVYMAELWGWHCHCPKFQFHNHQTSEHVSAYISHKISTSNITLIRKAMVSTEGSDERK